MKQTFLCVVSDAEAASCEIAFPSHDFPFSSTNFILRFKISEQGERNE